MTHRKPVPKHEHPKPEPTDYERFEDLAKKLARVPKREIDAERTKQNGNGK